MVMKIEGQDESFDDGALNLGNVTVLPVEGIETETVLQRKSQFDSDSAFSDQLDKVSAKEKFFYENQVFKYAEKVINSSNCNRANELLTDAKLVGDARADELNKAGKAKCFGSPHLRELLSGFRDELRNVDLANADQTDLEDIYKNISSKLLEVSRGKFGINVVDIDSDGVAKLEVRQVSSAAYFGMSREGMPEVWRERCMATGVCMIVRTSDNQILVQYRTKGNSQYSEIFGASIAGMFDAQLPAGYAEKVATTHLAAIKGSRDLKSAHEASQGVVGEITDASVLNQIKTEGREELGLKEKINQAKVVGIAEDLKKPHHEIVLLGTVDLTTTEIVDRAKNKFLSDKDKFDIPEWCVGIPASGEAIAILLTKVAVPIPPTHAAAFLAAGKALVVESQGMEAAKQWESKTVQGYRANQAKIDDIAIRATGNKYNPDKKASEQGFGDPIQLLREALEAVNLNLTTAR